MCEKYKTKGKESIQCKETVQMIQDKSIEFKNLFVDTREELTQWNIMMERNIPDGGLWEGRGHKSRRGNIVFCVIWLRMGSVYRQIKVRDIDPWN